MFTSARVIIERFRNKWFPTSDNKVWKQWVDYKHRETNDLIDLLTSAVRDSFKRRAVFLLLVPSEELNTIYWKEEIGKFYQRVDFLNKLSPALLSYATDLIVEFYSALKPVHCPEPKHYSQKFSEGMIFTSVPDKYHDALCFYNGCVLFLLRLIPEEQRERIFPLFSLRDISTYSNMDNASGYNPFESLLVGNVDEKWKRRADATMRQIIKDELSGKAKPRKDWENALQCYANIIKIQLYGDALHYDVALYADQIQFLVSEEHYDQQLVDTHEVAKIFQILSADIYKEIRRQVARFVVFGNRDEFKVWSYETLRGAQMMLVEFGPDDKELAQRVNSAIEEDQKRVAKRQHEEASAQSTEDNIMKQMR